MYTPPLAYVDLQRQIHLTTIQKILAEHEGFLRQFLVDDKVRLGKAGRGGRGGSRREEYSGRGEGLKYHEHRRNIDTLTKKPSTRDYYCLWRPRQLLHDKRDTITLNKVLSPRIALNAMDFEAA